MKKYGIEHFHIELVEETDNPNEREIFWIEYFGSFKNGYNATKGGDGVAYIDYDLVVATYKELKFIKDTADKLNIDTKTVRAILDARKESRIYSSSQASRIKTGKVINQYNLEGEFLQSFPSAKAAAESLGKVTSTSKGATSHITDVCRGKRKTAYGYIWHFAE